MSMRLTKDVDRLSRQVAHLTRLADEQQRTVEQLTARVIELETRPKRGRPKTSETAFGALNA